MLDFLLKVYALARPYRLRLWLGVLAGILGGLIEPLMIGIVAFVYGLIFQPRGATVLASRLQHWPEWIRDWLLSAEQTLSANVHASPWAAVLLVATIPAVLFLRGLLTYLNNYLLQWAAIRTVTDLRVRLFSHLNDLGAGFFSRASSGELISRVMNDTATLHNLLSDTTAVIVKDPVTVCSCLAFMLWVQPGLTVISLAVLPLCILPIVAYGRKVRRSSHAIQARSAELSQLMSEAFTGQRIIKAYNLVDRVREQFRATADQFISHYMRIVRSSEIPGPLLELVAAFGLALVLLYLVFFAVQRPDSEAFLRFVLVVFAIYRPLKNLARLYNNLERARAASERVFQLLDLRSDIVEPAHPQLLTAAGADIHFDHIDFAYDQKPVLSGVDLTVPSGRVVALVGASGSGKTTLANLLLRFYDPQAGSVRIGGVDIRNVSSRDLRNQVAVVTQETILFQDTIRNNIALGRPGASEEEIISAARHAHAHEFIVEKPQGYDAVLGEKGVNLSGGQRQRVAIARALLRNAPILILDEATSALDTESERSVQAALEELMQGRTTICIAHRLSTVQSADLIVVLDRGRIVETGTHAELLQTRGLYSKLHELQFESTPA